MGCITAVMFFTMMLSCESNCGNDASKPPHRLASMPMHIALLQQSKLSDFGADGRNFSMGSTCAADVMPQAFLVEINR
jgi:hypothetical protein